MVKRIGKIILLILVGSLPYWITDNINPFSSDYWGGLYRGDYNASVWYLYLYLGILVMLPILQSIKLTNKQHIYLLMLYLLGPGLFPLLNIYFSLPMPAAPLYYAVPSCYVVLLLTGNYLENQIDIAKLTTKKIIFIWVGLFLSLMLSFISAIYQLDTIGHIDYDSVYGTTYYSLTVCISICIYLLIRYYFRSFKAPFMKKIISQLGKYTLGIYLFGEFIRVRFEFIYDRLKANISQLAAVLIYSICIYLTGALVMFIFYSVKERIFKKR